MDHQHEVSKLLGNLQAGIKTVRNRIAPPQAASETVRIQIASPQAGIEAVRYRIASPTTNSISATNSIARTTRITNKNVSNQLRYHYDYF